MEAKVGTDGLSSTFLISKGLDLMGEVPIRYGDSYRFFFS